MEGRHPDVEELYDRYLDACHAGSVEEPDAFFARHPGIDTAGRERIRTLHRALAGGDDGALPVERLGEYRLVRRLGTGGMGAVYLAEQTSLKRLVALKVIRPELQASETAVKRFEREALAIGRLRHPNVVTVLELGEENGMCFLAMELVAGRPLDDVLADGRPPVPRAVRWVAALASALDAAHAEGIVHRDVKPGNVLLGPDDRPVLLDFGMAHLAEIEATTLTRSFAGSPPYAAPEQLSTGEIDARTDVYALGVTLYECLAGRRPFEGSTLEGLFRRILTEEPAPPSRLNPEVPRALDVVTLKALEKRPANRYPSAAAFAADLEAILERRPVAARPPGPLVRARRWARRRPAVATLVLAAAAFVAFLGVQAWQGARERRAEARRKVVEAGQLVDAYRASRDEARQVEARYQQLVLRAGDSYTTEEQDEELHAATRRRERIRRARERTFFDLMALLSQAERLDAGVAGADAVRARFYVEKMEEALIARDFPGAELYRELIDRHDPDGKVTAELRRACSLAIGTVPRGAVVEVVRFGEHPDEPRLVAVPLPGPLPPTPCETTLEPGAYQVLVHLDGFEDLRWSFDADPGERVDRTLTLLPAGSTPEGFVYIPYGEYWIMEREVTCAEYLPFLNDPAVRAGIDAADRPIRVPRGPEGVTWTRGPDGRYALPSNWDPRWPALGVSYRDAEAYARWLSARDGRAYVLPTRAEWTRAADGDMRRTYPFGNVWRAKWVSSCYSKPVAQPEPVMSYPIDRSPYGCYDLCGSAAEWIDDWFDEERGLKRLGGSSWGMTDPAGFAVWGGSGAPPDAASHSWGFRLAIRRR